MRIALALLVLLPQEAGDWKVGLAAVKITPEEPVPMSGYASRTKPFEGVNDDLWARALALEDAEGRVGVIVTSDLIGFRGPIAESICAKIAAKSGLKREQVLLNSTHTHSGPQTSLDPAAGEAIVRYTNRLEEKVVAGVAEALAKRAPARLSWGTGVAHFPMNRREWTPRGVILGVNPRGPADRSVPVLRVDGPDGKLRGVLFGCACHNTTLTDKNMLISGDYAGYAVRQVEGDRPGVQAMLMLGCGGDANPYPRGTIENAKDHGTALGREVGRVLDGKLQPVRGPLTTLFARVDLPLQEPLPREELEKIAKSGPSYRQPVAKLHLSLLEKGEKPPSTMSAPIALWRFGKDLTLVGLSGEVVVDYVRVCEEALGPLNLWVSAYCNDVFGYLPSSRVIAEGGYECRGTFSGGGFFSPAAQDAVAASLKRLSR
jgi:hypothetical protein